MDRTGFAQFFLEEAEADAAQADEPAVVAAVQRDPNRARVRADLAKDGQTHLRMAQVRGAKERRRLEREGLLPAVAGA